MEDMVNGTLQSEREELPAIMSVEELRNEVLLGVEEAKNGYGVRQEDFFEEMDKW